MRVTIMIMALALLASGCDRHERVDVSSQNLSGVWHLTEESLRLYVADGLELSPGQEFTIDLRTDGTCRFASAWDGFSPYYMEGVGSWECGKYNDGENYVSLRYERYENGEMVVGGLDLNVATVDGELTLWEYYGDRDSLKYTEYRKVK